MSLEFKSPAANDINWIRKILANENKMNSKSAPATCYLWSKRYSTKICEYKNMIIKKVIVNGVPTYECPQGAQTAKDFKKAIDAIINDAKENEYSQLMLFDFLDSEVQQTEEIFPGKFKFVPNRDNFEYIYKTENLALLPGKKYHGKKNHVSKFSKMFNWEYKIIIPTEKNRYLDFFEKWFESYMVDTPKSCDILYEQDAIKKTLENYETFGFFGGVIEVDDKIVACTIGEEINENVFLVHFEKALPEFRTAYSVINNEFCKTLLGKYEFINREEDLGIPGLRQAKLSYHPAFLLPKYNATLDSY